VTGIPYEVPFGASKGDASFEVYFVGKEVSGRGRRAALATARLPGLDSSHHRGSK